MSLDYESLFSKIDKAKKKKWTQADTDKWTKQQEKERKDKPNKKSPNVPFGTATGTGSNAGIMSSTNTKRGKYNRSQQQKDKLLGESSGEETGGTLSTAQRKARAAQAKLHGTKISTTPEPEHLSRVKLTPEQRRGRKRNAKRREQDKKGKEAELARAKTPPKQPTPDKEQDIMERKHLEGDLSTKKPFVSQGEEGVKERAEAEIKIRREHRDRKAYRKRHSASRYRKFLDELDAEDRSAKDRGEEEAAKQKKTKKQKKGKVVHATDQAAEYKRLMEEAGNIPGKLITARSNSISSKRSRADRKSRAGNTDEERPTPTEPIGGFVTEESEHESNEQDDERGDVETTDKSLWKSWLKQKDDFADEKRERQRKNEQRRNENFRSDFSSDSDKMIPTPKQIEWKKLRDEKEAQEVADKKAKHTHRKRKAWLEEVKRALRGKAMAIKNKYAKGHSKHGSPEKNRIALNERHRKRWHSKDPKDMEWKAAKIARDQKSSKKHGNWKVHRNRHLHQMRGSGQVVLTPAQEAKRVKDTVRSELLQEGRYQTGQGSKYDKKVVEGRYRREAGFDPKVGRSKKRRLQDDTNKMPDDVESEKQNRRSRESKIAREKLSPKEHTERKYGEQYKDPNVFGKKGIHPERIHNRVNPTGAQAKENKIQAGMRALEEVKRALNKAKKKKEVKLPQTKIDEPKHWWDHSKVGRQGDIDQKTGRPWWEVATEEKERKEKEKKKGSYPEKEWKFHSVGGLGWMEEVTDPLEKFKIGQKRREAKWQKDKEDKDEIVEANTSDANKADENEPYTEEEKKDPGVWTPKISDLRTVSERLNPKNPKHEYWRKYYNRNEIYKKPKFDPKQSEELKSWLEKRDDWDKEEASKKQIGNTRRFKRRKTPMQYYDEDDNVAYGYDKKTREELKAEEGVGGMNMGAQRGLGHEAGYKQDPGQSAQITEVKDKIDKIKKGELKPQKITEPNKVMDVVDEAHPKAEQINEKVREKIESMSVKSANENHEQDEGTEVKPNKQQIPASKPGMDTFKSLFKKSLVIKYNNLYKPLNT